MIRDLGRSLGNAVMEGVGRAASRFQERRPLPVDLLESEDAYLAVFDAPGARSEDVQVRFEDDAVHVRVDRFRDFHEGFEMRLPGRGLALDGSVRLPAGAAIDPSEATATVARNGTLRVEIPKAEGSTEMRVTDETVETEPADESHTEAAEGAEGGDDSDGDDGDGE